MTAGNAMLKVFTPKTKMPPNPNITACSNSATITAGKAAHPRIKPFKPFKTRCTLETPMGT